MQKNIFHNFLITEHYKLLSSRNLKLNELVWLNVPVHNVLSNIFQKYKPDKISDSAPDIKK